MTRLAFLALPAILLLAACDNPSEGPLLDPSPYAGPGEALNEPTDGAVNEIEADGG